MSPRKRQNLHTIYTEFPLQLDHLRIRRREIGKALLLKQYLGDIRIVI